jgi:hypothetical protein
MCAHGTTIRVKRSAAISNTGAKSICAREICPNNTQTVSLGVETFELWFSFATEARCYRHLRIRIKITHCSISIWDRNPRALSRTLQLNYLQACGTRPRIRTKVEGPRQDARKSGEIQWEEPISTIQLDEVTTKRVVLPLVGSGRRIISKTKVDDVS